jgi:hypothetical protein
MSSTALTRLYRPVRFLLDDRDPTIVLYEDAVLADGIKTVVELGLLNHAVITPPGGFRLSGDESAIEPGLDNPNLFALGCYHTALAFLGTEHDRYAYKTRPFAETFGNRGRYLASLEAKLHQLENGELFAGWQSMYSWFAGVSGLEVADILTQFDVASPLWSASLSGDGFRVS